MKEYEYVTIKYKSKGKVMAEIDEYHEIIDQYAKNGYRYAGMLPTEISVYGCYRKIELIFEKEDQ